MATRYDSHNIAYAWANQRSESGRCSAHMSFEGRDFYSYSTVIASIMTYKGRTAYLVNENHYSMTTCRHMSGVRQAIGGRNRFTVPADGFSGRRDADPANILSAWKRQAISRIGSLDDDDPRFYDLREAREIIAKMTAFANYFGLSMKPYSVKLPAPEQFLTKWQKDIRKILAHTRKMHKEMHPTIVIEAYKVVRRQRGFAREAGIPIEAFKVRLPMKEQDIKAAIEDRQNSADIRARLLNSAPSTGANIINGLDALLAGMPTTEQAA